MLFYTDEWYLCVCVYQAHTHTQHPMASASEWGEVHISLPAEAAHDFAGKSSAVLRTAMRQAGAIITLEPPTADNSSTVLIIEGTHAAIMRSHRHISKCSHVPNPKP
jgi:hypothetical protein